MAESLARLHKNRLSLYLLALIILHGIANLSHFFVKECLCWGEIDALCAEPTQAEFSKRCFLGKIALFVWVRAFVCRCLCWRWENKGLNGYREKRRGENPSLYSTYPTPSSILLPYSAWLQTLGFCMEGTRETIHSLCLENTGKERDRELPGALPPVKSPVRRSVLFLPGVRRATV